MELVLQAFDPADDDLPAKQSDQALLFEGMVHAIRIAKHIDANRLHSLLSKFAERLNNALDSQAASEARTYFVLLLKLFSTILDQMVMQQIHPKKGEHYKGLLEQVGNIRLEHGLGERRVDQLHKLFCLRKITFDDEILYSAVYAQQGLEHLLNLKNPDASFIKEHQAEFEAVLFMLKDLGSTLKKSAISVAAGLLIGVGEIQAVIVTSVALTKMITKLIVAYHPPHVWYSLIKSYSSILLMSAVLDDLDSFNNCLDNINKMSKKVKKVFKCYEKGLLADSSYSFFLFGIIDSVADSYFKIQKSEEANASEIRGAVVGWLCQVYSSYFEGENGENWGDHRNVFDRSRYQLERILFTGQASKDDEDKIRKAFSLEKPQALVMEPKFALLETAPEFTISREELDMLKFLGDQIDIWKNNSDTKNFKDTVLNSLQKIYTYSASIGGKQQVRLRSLSKLKGKKTFLDVDVRDIDFCVLRIAEYLQALFFKHWKFFDRYFENGKLDLSKASFNGAFLVVSNLGKLLMKLSEAKVSESVFVDYVIRSTIQKMHFYFLKYTDNERIKGIQLNFKLFVGDTFVECINRCFQKGTERDQFKQLSMLVDEAPWGQGIPDITRALYWEIVEQKIPSLIQRNANYPKVFQDDFKYYLLLKKLYQYQPGFTFRGGNTELDKWAKSLGMALDPEPKIHRKSLVLDAVIERHGFAKQCKDEWKKIKVRIGHYVARSVKGKKDYGFLEEFLKEDGAKSDRVMLITGKPGSGKSIFAYNLADFVASGECGDYIPVFVKLGSLKNPSTEGLDSLFDSARLSDKELADWKEKKQFCFFCDGFDEMGDQFRPVCNNPYGEWKKSKFIFLSRPNSESDFQSLFDSMTGYLDDLPVKDLQKYELEEFLDSERNEFIEKYKLKSKKRKLSTVLGKIKDYKIHELSCNPFFLKLFLDSFEELKELEKSGLQNKEMRPIVYELAFDGWAKRENKKVTSREGVYINKPMLINFATGLALVILRKNKGNEIDLSDKNEFDFDLTDFGLDHVKNFAPKMESLKALKDYGSLLINYGDARYGFMHRTLLEYFAALGIYQSIQTLIKKFNAQITDKDFEKQLAKSAFNFCSIAKQEQGVVIDFLYGMLKNADLEGDEETRKATREFLKKVLELPLSSPEDSGQTRLVYSSGNALTLQHLLGEKLSSLDEVRVHEANLSFGILHALEQNPAGVSYDGIVAPYAFINHENGAGVNSTLQAKVSSMIQEASLGNAVGEGIDTVDAGLKFNIFSIKASSTGSYFVVEGRGKGNSGQQLLKVYSTEQLGDKNKVHLPLTSSIACKGTAPFHSVGWISNDGNWLVLEKEKEKKTSLDLP